MGRSGFHHLIGGQHDAPYVWLLSLETGKDLLTVDRSMLLVEPLIDQRHVDLAPVEVIDDSFEVGVAHCDLVSVSVFENHREEHCCRWIVFYNQHTHRSSFTVARLIGEQEVKWAANA